VDEVGSGGGDEVRCSFCAKASHHVKKLIAGPGVYICDECVELCNDIVGDEGGGAPMPGSSHDSIAVPRHELTGVVRALDQAIGAIGSSNPAVADEAGRLAGRLHRRLQEPSRTRALEDPGPGPDPGKGS
jgi:hypothetical protein